MPITRLYTTVLLPTCPLLDCILLFCYQHAHYRTVYYWSATYRPITRLYTTVLLPACALSDCILPVCYQQAHYQTVYYCSATNMHITRLNIAGLLPTDPLPDCTLLLCYQQVHYQTAHYCSATNMPITRLYSTIPQHLGDYILVKKRFRSGIKTAKTRAFPGADIGSDHDMVMTTFQTRLKNSRKPTQPRIGFDLEKLNDSTVMSAFQAIIGGRFASLVTLADEGADLDTMVTRFNKAVTDTAAELLGKQRRKRRPWVTPEILDLCDQRRGLKKKRGDTEEAKDYREIKRKIRTEMMMAKETWT